jgi:DNA invertase Pin-like site-specific DNA recombinase
MGGSLEQMRPLPAFRLRSHVFAAMAEVERNVIWERTRPNALSRP